MFVVQKRKLILLYYTDYLHHIMVERLASEMSSFGIDVDVLCRSNYLVVRHSNVRWALYSEAFMWLLRHIRFVRNRKFSRILFQKCLFSEIASHYELVDFHVFSSNRIPLMRACLNRKIPFDITLWGSEILRATPEHIARMEYGFAGCRYIKGSQNLLLEVSEKYVGRFNSKLRTVYFGQTDFENIDAIDDEIVISFRDHLSVHGGDCIIACGYNAVHAQQHLRILECLGSLPDDIKSSIFIILQMTYPSDSEYVNTVSRAADKAGLRYKVFDSYLSCSDIASIRKISDIVVNMQTTDAFAGSIQGALYAGDIVLSGEWLCYSILDDNNIYYLKVSFDNLVDTIKDVVSQMDYYRSNCSRNHAIMKNLTSWPAVIGDWATLYNA